MDNMSNPVNLALDALDLRLAKELELDARQTNRLLATRLATSEGTVKRRLQRLIDERIIRIVTISHRVPMGLPIGLTIGLNVRPGKTDKVTEHLLPHRSVQIINLTTGRYNILIGTVFHDVNEQNGFLAEDLCRVPHLASAEVMMMVRGIKISWKYLNNDTTRYQEPMFRHLDELDLKLIRELELCPRESVIKLAEKVKVNRNVAGRRLRSLLIDGIVQVVSIPEPSISHLNISVFIFAKVQPDKVGSVANSLVAEKSVHRIYIVAGRFNLLMNAAFRDVAELSDFVRNRLCNYPGIISHETMIQLATLKSSFSLLS